MNVHCMTCGFNWIAKIGDESGCPKCLADRLARQLDAAQERPQPEPIPPGCLACECSKCGHQWKPDAFQEKYTCPRCTAEKIEEALRKSKPRANQMTKDQALKIVDYIGKQLAPDSQGTISQFLIDLLVTGKAAIVMDGELVVCDVHKSEVTR